MYVNKKVIIPSGTMNKICSTCEGSGKENCFRCGGTGTFTSGETCYYCQGDGYIVCKACDGKGYLD